MVDVNTQNKTISVNVSSSGVSSNVNASGDASHYYSEKAREWAISNRIVDNTDYSSKYYAGSANQSALNAQSFAQSAQDSYNNVQNVANNALDDIETDKVNAISDINSTKSTALTDINSTKSTALTDINSTKSTALTDINSAKNNAVNTINTTASSLANRDLSNLSNVGEKHFLNKSQITNCILECPQEISSDNTIADPNDAYRGIGYIGATIWVDKGLKYLIPNSRNTDGTLKNIEVTTTNFYSRDLSTLPNGTWALLLQRGGTITTHRLSDCSYDFENNHNITTNNEVNMVANLGYYVIENGAITEFNVQKPIRLASYEEMAEKVDIENLIPINAYVVRSYFDGSSGVMLYSHGLLIQWGISASTNANTQKTISLFEDYLSGTSYVALVAQNKLSSNYGDNVGVSSQTASSFTIRSQSGGAQWFTIGYTEVENG